MRAGRHWRGWARAGAMPPLRMGARGSASPRSRRGPRVRRDEVTPRQPSFQPLPAAMANAVAVDEAASGVRRTRSAGDDAAGGAMPVPTQHGAPLAGAVTAVDLLDNAVRSSGRGRGDRHRDGVCRPEKRGEHEGGSGGKDGT